MVFSCQFAPISFSLRKSMAYLKNLLFSEFAHATPFALGGVASTLPHHILHILFMGAEEEMGDIVHTCGVVASVANFKAIRNWATIQFPNDTGGSLEFPVKPNMPIPIQICRCCPQPTFPVALSVYLFPQPLFNWPETGFIMTTTESYGLALDAIISDRSSGCDGGTASASTATQPYGDFLNGFIGDILAHVGSLLHRFLTTQWGASNTAAAFSRLQLYHASTMEAS